MPFLVGTPEHGEPANGYIDLMNKLTAFLDRNNQHVATVSIVNGGAGYAVGDFAEIQGGSPVGSMRATVEVRAVAAGVVTQVDIASMGTYSSPLAGTLATTSLSGTGLTLTTTMGVNGYDILLDQVVDTTEHEFIVRGEGMDAAQQMFFGARSYRNVTSDIYNWEITGFTGYQSGVDFFDQPGQVDAAQVPESPTVDLPMWNGTIPYWFYVNNQSVVVVTRIATTYQTAYMGFGLPFGPLSLYPYPLTWIGMCNGGADIRYSVNDFTVSNFTEPFNGSGYVRWVDGNIFRASNHNTGGGGEELDHFQTWPHRGDASLGSSVDGNYSNNGVWFDLHSAEGWLRNIRDMGGDYPLFPFFTFMTTAFTSFGLQYDQVFWISGFQLSSEDFVEQNGQKFRVFQNAGRNTQESFFAVLEA